jgi:hypothetical protein
MTTAMKTERSSAATAVLSTFVVLTSLLGVYVGGYFGLGECFELSRGAGKYRIYRYKWLANVFVPAAWIESKLTGEDVGTEFEGPRFYRVAVDQGFIVLPRLALNA